MKKEVLLIILTTLFLSSTFANAQTLNQRKAQQKETSYFDHEVASMNKKCGTNITAKIDYSSFKPEDYKSNKSFHGYCEAPVSQIFLYCRDNKKLEMEAVKSSIKSIICKRGAERSASLKDGELVYTIDFKSYNDQDFIKKFFGENL